MEVFEITGFSTERSDRAIVEAADETSAINALQAKLEADEFEGMTERALWKATPVTRPLLYIDWWS